MPQSNYPYVSEGKQHCNYLSRIISNPLYAQSIRENMSQTDSPNRWCPKAFDDVGLLRAWAWIIFYVYLVSSISPFQGQSKLST